MRQYTTPDQTSKLIELGVETPKSISSIKVTGGIITTAEDLIGEPSSVMGGKISANYSIGELIEMLPDNSSKRIRYVATKRAWIVDVDVLGKQGRCHKGVYYAELIDALYALCVKLKEEGVI